MKIAIGFSLFHWSWFFGTLAYYLTYSETWAAVCGCGCLIVSLALIEEGIKEDW